MKKIASLFLLTLLLAASFSCGKEDPKTDDPQPVVKPDPPVKTEKVLDYDTADLKDLAAKAGIKLGAAFTYGEYTGNAAVAGILKRDFAAVTFGNEMKHDAIVQGNGTYNFARADQMAGWARTAGADLFGHVLGWHSQQQRTYLNGLVAKASPNNSKSLLQKNWNFEEGSLDGYTASGFELLESLYDVFAGDFAAKSVADGATLRFNVPLEEGVAYTVSFWAKSLGSGGTVSFSLGEGEEATSSVTSAWRKYSAAMTPASAGETVCRLTASKDVVIDNIRVIDPDGQGVEVPTGGSIDFESLSAGGAGQLTESGLFVQVNGSDYVSVTDEAAHGGSLTLKMDNADGHATNSWDVQVVTKAFPVEVGKTYRISWYGKASAEADFQIDIRGDGEVQYKSSSYNQFAKTGTDWTLQTLDYTVTQGSSLSIGFYGAVAAVTYYIDDIVVAPVQAAGAPAARRTASLGTSTALDGELASDAIGYAFRDYVYTMVAHFDVYAWDVVNETFTDYNPTFRTGQNSPDPNFFIWGDYFASTKQWVDKAFAYATDALERSGKKAVLYLNDYDLETSDAKRKAYLDYVKGNPQVTGAATQMHIDMATPGLKDKIVATLTDLVSTGRMVRIAELDIKCTDMNAQADLYKFIFQKYLEIVPAAQRGGITIWGINDKDSWVGENNAPLLYAGSTYIRKPAYEAIYLYLCELAGVDPYKEVPVK